MSSLSRQKDPHYVRDYASWNAVEPGKFWEGCILWIRDKSSINRHIPALTDGFRMEEWVYGHPCVILSPDKQKLQQVVVVAPVTSHPSKMLSEYIQISHANAVNASQLSLRSGRSLEKQSYVKKICFEIDLKMLALYSGVPANHFRLTKGSMKKLLAEMPDVIKWAPLSQDKMVAPKIGLGQPTKSAEENSVRDVEAQPLLGQPDVSVVDYGSRGVPSTSPGMVQARQTWHLLRSTFKLVLSVPLLLMLIACLSTRFIVDIVSKGPLTTYKAGVALLLTLCTGDLVALIENYDPS